MAQQRFTEFFPITQDIPPLAAYRLHGPGAGEAAGSRIAYRLGKALGARWVWSDGVLLTDVAVSPIQVDITLDMLHGESPELFSGITGVSEDLDWGLTPVARAQYVLKTAVRSIEDDIISAVARMTTTHGLLRVVREPVYQPWQVNDEAALSISLKLHALHDLSLHAWMQSRTEKIKHYIGWQVMDPTTLRMIGTITATNGLLVQHRARLLTLTQRPAMQRIIAESPDSTVIFRVQAGPYEYEYPATALHAVLHPQDEARIRFLGLEASQVSAALTLSPAVRASNVKVLADLFKQHQIVGGSYNSRTHPELFAQAEVLPSIIVADRKPRTLSPHHNEQLRHAPYQGAAISQPLKTAAVSLLDEVLVSDFVEALRRQLERDTAMELDLLRTQRLSNPAPNQVEGALRLIEKNSPDIVLLFIRDTTRDCAALEHIRARLHSAYIPLQVITEQDVNDPVQMPVIINTIQMHMGAIPFIFANPLECADIVAGLRIDRDTRSGTDHIRAVAHLYHADGRPIGTAEHTCELDEGEPLPLVLVQALMPTASVAGSRLMVHVAGSAHRGLRKALRKWAELNQCEVSVVEVIESEAPRLYGLEKSITHPAWSSMLMLNTREALLVTQQPHSGDVAQPLLIRVTSGTVPIEFAVYSVLLWSALPYGSTAQPALPATLRTAAPIHTHALRA